MGAQKVQRFNGARLRQARHALGDSQSQFAHRIGAHSTSVSDWERGENEPSGRHLATIARETGMPIEHFFGDDEDEEEPQMTLALAGLSLDDIVRIRIREIARQERGS